MKIEYWLIGKHQDAWVAEMMDKYLTRLRSFQKVAVKTYPSVKAIKGKSQEQIKELESKAIFKDLMDSDYLILLDENGVEHSSEAFADQLEQWLMRVPGRIIFLVGGAYGFDSSLYKKANYKLSLSKMTLTHQMVRVFFIEQLYRAFTIRAGQKYHHS